MTSLYDLNRSCKSDQKACCPPMPHYTLPLSDEDFIQRNIALTNEGGGVNLMSTIPDYAYPGDLAYDESQTLAACQYDEWKRQEGIARRCVYPNKFWQDLNSGRQGYARGLSDALDNTIAEINAPASGWLQGLAGVNVGGAPWRCTRAENFIPEDPMNNRIPLVNQTEMGNRHYFYSIYSLNDQPRGFCQCNRSLQVRMDEAAVDWKRGASCSRCSLPFRYPERYN